MKAKIGDKVLCSVMWGGQITGIVTQIHAETETYKVRVPVDMDPCNAGMYFVSEENVLTVYEGENK